MKRLRQFSYKLLTGNHLGKFLVDTSANLIFPGSKIYWERRYRNNGNSGVGSFGEKAAYKANFLNKFVEERAVNSVTELGCGDGNQLTRFRFPKYTGLDVSRSAIEKCKGHFIDDCSKSFSLFEGRITSSSWEAELTLSLDVVYHLVEDEVFESYMHCLFGLAKKYVIIYAWDVEEEKRYHIRHRHFSKWICNNVPAFKLINRVSKEGFCDFFVYERAKISGIS